MTCRRAKEFLSRREVSLRERDFFRERLSEAELRELLAGISPAQAFAWKSPRARAMKLDAANPPSDEELRRLMLDVPYLIRRPIIRVGGRTFFGFSQKQLETALPQQG